MKKVLLILFTISILLIAGCGQQESVKQEEVKIAEV